MDQRIRRKRLPSISRYPLTLAEAEIVRNGGPHPRLVGLPVRIGSAGRSQCRLCWHARQTGTPMLRFWWMFRGQNPLTATHCTICIDCEPTPDELRTKKNLPPLTRAQYFANTPLADPEQERYP